LIREMVYMEFELTTPATQLAYESLSTYKGTERGKLFKSHKVHHHLGVILCFGRLEREMEVSTYDCSNHA
jgi:hypothetical protein